MVDEERETYQMWCCVLSQPGNTLSMFTVLNKFTRSCESHVTVHEASPIVSMDVRMVDLRLEPHHRPLIWEPTHKHIIVTILHHKSNLSGM